MTLDVNSTVVRIEGLMTAPVDNEIVILNMRSNCYISLDPIGCRIWELLESPTTVESLCTRLQQEFDGPRDQITADVIDFITQLEKDGLLRVTEG